jgi:predicted polyphosphate/ATP-dependent NAD kinase
LHAAIAGKNSVSAALHIGLVVNPLAGLGGGLAMKGSDGEVLRALAETILPARGSRAIERTVRALRELAACTAPVRFSCWAGNMGEEALRQAGIHTTVLGSARSSLTSATDTRLAARELYASGVDILLFAGGDGTARDILDVIGTRCPVLGVPAGVKMQSGVFAVSPEAAGSLLRRLAEGGLVGVKAREVRDIDEEAARRDVVRSRYYGELLVPGEGEYLQQTKIGGREDADLAAADIASWQVASMAPGHTYLIGPGSTTAAIMAELGLANTLLGVDVVRDRELVASDADEQRLLQVLGKTTAPASIIVTAIGGQGHLFGRGNQQFSPAVIRRVGLDNIIIVAAKSKIAGLGGRPLLVDTNDVALDGEFCGLRTVCTGYDDYLLYRVGSE